MQQNFLLTYYGLITMTSYKTFLKTNMSVCCSEIPEDLSDFAGEAEIPFVMG